MGEQSDRTETLGTIKGQHEDRRKGEVVKKRRGAGGGGGRGGERGGKYIKDFIWLRYTLNKGD